MSIEYHQESEKYRPESIRTLLVGEAPPPNGKTYFYVPRPISNEGPIEKARSLPATIFNHYFQERPTSLERYIILLTHLKDDGIFLIDICSEPIRVRNCPEGVSRIIDEIPKLRIKMVEKSIHVADQDIIFLLARNSYKKYILREFPDSQLYTWKDFRMSS